MFMETYVSGTISVKAVLEEKKREIMELWVNPKKRSRDIAYLIAIAKQNEIPVVFKDGKEMNETASSNGGVILLCKSRTLPQLSASDALHGLCVYISGVEDPYNLGSIARTLYAAGASKMIIQKRDWSFALPTLMRSSAGAWERLEICTIENDEVLIQTAKNANREIVCAARDDDARPLFGETLEEDSLIAIGGAMRGLSSAVLEAGKTHLYIPYGREFRNALDSVSAASVFAFAWTKDHENRRHS